MSEHTKESAIATKMFQNVISLTPRHEKTGQWTLREVHIGSSDGQRQIAKSGVAEREVHLRSNIKKVNVIIIVKTHTMKGNLTQGDPLVSD